MYCDRSDTIAILLRVTFSHHDILQAGDVRIVDCHLKCGQDPGDKLRKEKC